MEFVISWFRRLHDDAGINFSIVYDSFDRMRFLRSIGYTIEISAICIVVSVAIGVAGAWLQMSSMTVVRRATNAYVQLFRNTPPMVQLYFFVFGLGAALPSLSQRGVTSPVTEALIWLCISLSLFAGAFNVEIFRSGIEAIPSDTTEAAEALGLSRLRTYVHIVLPLAVRTSLPALNNNLVNLVKTTTLGYAVAVPELLYTSSQIWSDQTNVPEMMAVLLIVYFGITGAFAGLMGLLERRLRLPGYGRPR